MTKEIKIFESPEFGRIRAPLKVKKVKKGAGAFKGKNEKGKTKSEK